LKGLARAARHARLSRVVTAALLSDVAEVIALPDLRSEVAEDRVRNRDVEEEVGRNQVPDVGTLPSRQKSFTPSTSIVLDNIRMAPVSFAVASGLPPVGG
jgi:hypothetical protein